MDRDTVKTLLRQGRSDQLTAGATEMATLVATYYRTLREQDVDIELAVLLTEGYQEGIIQSAMLQAMKPTDHG